MFFLTGQEYFWGEMLIILLPSVILLMIGYRSLNLLYDVSVRKVNPDLMIKVVGSQWYWNYEIRDFEDVVFTSYIKSLDDLVVGDTRFLEVDNRLTLPVNKNLQFNITSSDVIHSFAVPSLGLKGDATAGVLNVLSTKIEKCGVYRGQCSEICGANHSYMPIQVEVTTFLCFRWWLHSYLV